MPSIERNVLITGVGKINATLELTKELMYRPEIKTVINYGSAGSISPQLEGLIKCSTFVEGEREEWTHDIKFPTTGLTCSTQDCFALSPPSKDCDIVDMEAYAVAKVCKCFGKSFFCYKFISDHIGENNQEEVWKQNLPKGESLFIKKLLLEHSIEV